MMASLRVSRRGFACQPLSPSLLFVYIRARRAFACQARGQLSFSPPAARPCSLAAAGDRFSRFPFFFFSFRFRFSQQSLVRSLQSFVRMSRVCALPKARAVPRVYSSGCFTAAVTAKARAVVCSLAFRVRAIPRWLSASRREAAVSVLCAPTLVGSLNGSPPARVGSIPRWPIQLGRRRQMAMVVSCATKFVTQTNCSPRVRGGPFAQNKNNPSPCPEQGALPGRMYWMMMG